MTTEQLMAATAAAPLYSRQRSGLLRRLAETEGITVDNARMRLRHWQMTGQLRTGPNQAPAMFDNPTLEQREVLAQLAAHTAAAMVRGYDPDDAASYAMWQIGGSSHAG